MWLRDDIPQPINDEPIIRQDNPHIKVEVEFKSKIQVFHYHNDQLGTPNELTNQQGEVVWLADYEAWGNTAKVVYKEVKINQIAVSQVHLQPIRFQGQHFDIETGLHYNRFRYYDPDMRMFTTRDPIGLMGGDNVFAYAPNPTGFIDPLGLNDFGALEHYGNSPGITAAINNAKTQQENIASGKVQAEKPFIKNKTIMSNLSITGRLGVGVEVTVSTGKSYDKNGKTSQCYSIMPCVTAGTDAKVLGSATGSISNSSTSPGISTATQFCLDGGGAAAVALLVEYVKVQMVVRRDQQV